MPAYATITVAIGGRTIRAGRPYATGVGPSRTRVRARPDRPPAHPAVRHRPEVRRRTPSHGARRDAAPAAVDCGHRPAGGRAGRARVHAQAGTGGCRTRSTRATGGGCGWRAGLVLAATLAALGGLAGAWRAFERQRRLGEMKSNFVASVSHELRAPIGAMRLMTESLERGTVTDAGRQHEYFRIIGQECRRLSSLVENVLDFSRIDRGSRTYTFEPADLDALVARTVELMRPYAAERQVELVQPTVCGRQSSRLSANRRGGHPAGADEPRGQRDQALSSRGDRLRRTRRPTPPPPGSSSKTTVPASPKRNRSGSSNRSTVWDPSCAARRRASASASASRSTSSRRTAARSPSTVAPGRAAGSRSSCRSRRSRRHEPGPRSYLSRPAHPRRRRRGADADGARRHPEGRRLSRAHGGRRADRTRGGHLRAARPRPPRRHAAEASTA